MKKFLNESDKKKIISEKEKMIIESFAKTFNKIKRIDENEINENVDYTQEELDEYFNAKNELFEIIGNETNEVDIPKRLMKLKNKGVKFIPEIIKEKIFPKNEWWENRFRQTTFFDFVDEESGDVYSFIADDEDWWEGMPRLYPYSKHELSFLYENNLIDNAPKNAMDGIKFKNASPDLSNANLHSINEINEYDDDFEKSSRETEFNINPYKNQDDIFVTNYKQIDDQTILVQTSDNNVEEFYYVTDETEGTSEMDSTTYITFRNENDSRELIAKTNYNPNGISFDSLDFIKVKNI